MSTQCLSRGRRSSSSTLKPTAAPWPLSMSSCKTQSSIQSATPRGYQQQQMVADALHCRLSEVTVITPTKTSPEINLLHSLRGEFLALWKNIQISDGALTAALVYHTEALPEAIDRSKGSIALVSTFYETQITTNHSCLVTVSQAKLDFLHLGVQVGLLALHTGSLSRQGFKPRKHMVSF